MKSIFLASAAAAALFAAPALAQQAIGSVGVNYANTEVDDFDADAWSVDGVVALPVGSEWTATLNGEVTYYDDAAGDDTTVSAAGHLTKMWTGDIRAGGFVAANDIGDDTVWTVGAEAQKYLAAATLTGLVAYTDVDALEADMWTVGGDAAFYVQPNLRLNAGVSYNDLDSDLGGSLEAWTYGVGAEYEFTGTPFSVAAGFNRADIKDVDLDVDTWTVGLRYSFGGGLQARDRAGANLGVASIVSVLGGL